MDAPKGVETKPRRYGCEICEATGIRFGGWCEVCLGTGIQYHRPKEMS
jgi:hypothetical protein